VTVLLLRTTTTSNLIAVRRLLVAPDDPEVCGPALEQRYACTANEPGCRSPGCCSARPLSDTMGQDRAAAGDDVRDRHRQVSQLALLLDAYTSYLS
jgi:hypothetical protein